MSWNSKPYLITTWLKQDSSVLFSSFSGLFGNLKEIINVSSAFLETLTTDVKIEDCDSVEKVEPHIGKGFLIHAETMKKVYTEYCINHDKAEQLLEKYEQIPEVFFYFIYVLVFCYQNCSNLLWEINCSSDWEKLLKFEAEGREFAKFLRSLDQFIQTVKGQNNFW